MPKLQFTLDTKDWLDTCGSCSGSPASMPTVHLTLPADAPSTSLEIFVSGGGSGVTILTEVSSSTAVKYPTLFCSNAGIAESRYS
ncbi:hypothetical protein TSUD_362520 [Trifolium subterraneum]|uniref:Uncharacterized protein n=1 Tax=Trifolium subterraneum TaxID=3900 RepID=A0A2Z6NIZ3_TRISU|nr:hypothetical protein TSUD_362520 [Trifolium subterraneum]